MATAFFFADSLEWVRITGVRCQTSLHLAGNLQPIPEVHRKEVPMPTTTEFTIRLDDRPGTLGKLCQALAEQNVNILAFHSCSIGKGKSAVRFVLDNPATAKSILDREKTDYTQTEVARVTLSHRPGELARAATRLGQAGINIDYGYCGVDPSTNATMLLLGVADASKAAKVLEQAAAASAT
jgi:hypothetical protein